MPLGGEQFHKSDPFLPPSPLALLIIESFKFPSHNISHGHPATVMSVVVAVKKQIGSLSGRRDAVKPPRIKLGKAKSTRNNMWCPDLSEELTKPSSFSPSHFYLLTYNPLIQMHLLLLPPLYEGNARSTKDRLSGYLGEITGSVQTSTSLFRQKMPNYSFSKPDWPAERHLHITIWPKFSNDQNSIENEDKIMGSESLLEMNWE